MIEKTFVVSKNGTVLKDFQNRAISQYLHNAIQVNVDIPNACFENLDNYGVEMACAICDATGREIQTLSTLFMMLNDTQIEGYKRFSCVLSIAYTKRMGKLKLTPYIRTTLTEEIDGVEQTFIAIQQTFTNTYLNVEFAVPNTSSVELEDAPIITQLENVINELTARIVALEGGSE